MKIMAIIIYSMQLLSEGNCFMLYFKSIKKPVIMEDPAVCPLHRGGLTLSPD